MIYTVRHEFYGCDTGCCGFRIRAYDNADQAQERYGREYFRFCYERPSEHMREWAAKLVHEAFGGSETEIAWNQCFLPEDCSFSEDD